MKSLLQPRDSADLEFYTVESWHREDLAQALADGDGIPYGWLKGLPGPDGADFVTSRYLTGSDYNGGALVKANRTAWDAETDPEHGLSVSTFGGLGTEGRLLRLDVELTDENREEAARLLEILRSLSDYPVIDDEALSEQENADADEAWDGYGCRDFSRALSAQHNIDADDIEEKDGALRILFDNADNGSGLVEHDESGASFDTERAAERTPLPFLFYLGIVNPPQAAMIELALADPDEARRYLRLFRIGEALRLLERGSIDRWRILSAKVDAGDCSGPIDEQTMANRALRSFRLTFQRWDHKAREARTLTVEIDILGVHLYNTVSAAAAAVGEFFA